MRGREDNKLDVTGDIPLDCSGPSLRANQPSPSCWASHNQYYSYLDIMMSLTDTGLKIYTQLSHRTDWCSGCLIKSSWEANCDECLGSRAEHQETVASSDRSQFPWPRWLEGGGARWYQTTIYCCHHLIQRSVHTVTQTSSNFSSQTPRLLFLRRRESLHEFHDDTILDNCLVGKFYRKYI